MDQGPLMPLRRPDGVPAFLPVPIRDLPPQVMTVRQDLFTALELQPLYDVYVRYTPDIALSTSFKLETAEGSRSNSSHGRQRSGNRLGGDLTSTALAAIPNAAATPSGKRDRRRSDAAVTGIKQEPRTGPVGQVEAPPSPSGSLDGNGKPKVRVLKTRARKFGRFWDDLLQDTIDVKLEDKRPTLRAIIEHNYPDHLDHPNFRFERITNLEVRAGMRLGLGKASGVSGEYKVVADRKTGKQMVVKEGAMTANQRRKARKQNNAALRVTAPPTFPSQGSNPTLNSGLTSAAQTPFPFPERASTLASPMGSSWSPGFGAGGGEYFTFSPGYGGGQSPVGSPRGYVGSPKGGRTPGYGGATPRQ